MKLRYCFHLKFIDTLSKWRLFLRLNLCYSIDSRLATKMKSKRSTFASSYQQTVLHIRLVGEGLLIKFFFTFVVLDLGGEKSLKKMKLFLVSFFLVLFLASLSEARPRRSFFVPANDGNGCGYASCPAYNASAKVIIFKTNFYFLWTICSVFLNLFLIWYTIDQGFSTVWASSPVEIQFFELQPR